MCFLASRLHDVFCESNSLTESSVFSRPDFPTPDEKIALAKRIVDTFPVLRDEKTPNGYVSVT